MKSEEFNSYGYNKILQMNSSLFPLHSSFFTLPSSLFTYLALVQKKYKNFVSSIKSSTFASEFKATLVLH